MNDELMLDVGQANELKLAFRREGLWTNEKIKALTEQKGLLTQVLEVLEGRAEIKSVEYLINLNAKPFVPNGWNVEEHQKGGNWKYDATKVGLYLSKKQQDGVIGGHDLRKELKGQLVMNANMLEFYLKFPHLIPPSWEGKEVYFWGTIYSGADCNLAVRYIYGDGRNWYWRFRWLKSDWCDLDPAVVRESLGIQI